MLVWLILSMYLTTLDHLDPVIQRQSSTNVHPYYVSVSELEWNEKEKSVELAVKIYTDDFEEALKTFSGKKYDLSKGEADANRTIIENYIRKQFLVQINGREIAFSLLGYENAQEATWCYLQSPQIPIPAEVHVSNALIYEVKKEQVNIVHLKLGEKRKSFRLVNPEKDILWAPDK